MKHAAFAMRLARTADLQRPIHHIAHRCGGSPAQRDLIALTPPEAARRN